MSDEEITIEQASAHNAKDALALIEEYYEEVNVVARDSRAALMQILSDPDCGVWVAYEGAIPVGCILYRPLPHLELSGEMKRLYVRPGYRGQGIALRLLQTLESFAESRGDTCLYLDTKDDLVAAQRFYEHQGYLPCERYNDNPQATIFMRKTLPAK